MCGIAGFWSSRATAVPLDDALRRMTDCIDHRGPDDTGVWCDATAGIALGHRRLSIIDLSAAGHQPMASPSRRYWTAFNGEIYNFRELRDELRARGATFSGSSDTEVILVAIETWGLERAVRAFAGMFSLAIWDRQARALHLIRDRIGEKPLYYGWMNEAFVFGSELKALRAHPAWRAEIDGGALALYLRHSYVPAPHSIYRNVYKVRPGTILTVHSPRMSDATEAPYWSARAVAEHGTSDPLAGSDEELVDICEARLTETIRQEMIADVPLGAFLSGGIDSSLIVALMQANSARAVRTFTIGFHVPEFNEAEHARRVAASLGTEHTELYVTPQETRDVIPRLPALYDEPFADASQIPTFLVAQLARQHVTVALSGDGGDELFGGYDRYALGDRIWSSIGWIPSALRRGMANGLQLMSPDRWDAVLTRLRPVLPARGVMLSGDRIHKLASFLGAPSSEAMYRDMVSYWREPERVAVGGAEPMTVLSDPAHQPQLSGFMSRMMFLDLMTYLPDDILVKVDRATMGVSLESRAPFLDHRVVELAWRLPMRAKIRGGRGKWILRQILERYVPRVLFERPKMGFGVPIDQWLRGPLREWAGALLDPTALRHDGIFDETAISEAWSQHQSGARNWQYPLWNILMFRAWLRTNV